MKHILLIFLLILTVVGCQKPIVKRSLRQLKINFQEGDLPSLHPHDLVIYLRGLSLAKTLFEPLTRINAEGEVELAGAKSVEVSSDQLRYTFTLRQNFWSDGTLVTAQQYESAWKSVLTPQSTCTRADLLYCIKNAEEAKKGALSMEAVGVKAVNDNTLVVELLYPTPYFLELTAQCVTAPLKDLSKGQVEFNGPFMVVEWKKGDLIRLKPNPHYWDKAHIQLESIEIYFMEDVNTTFSLYEKGGLDWVGVPLCPLSPELIQHLLQKKSLASKAIGRSFWIFLNTECSALNSTKIRQALSLAIDREEITDHILIGGQPSIKPLSMQLLPLAPLKPLKENIAEAQALFEEGLHELGYTRQTLPVLEISYSQQANRKQIAEYLQEQWKKIFSIDVQLKSVEWNVLRSNLDKGLFTVSMAYEGAYYRDPLELLERYASLGPSNFCRWLHPSFSQKIAEAKYEINFHARMQLLAEAEKILVEEMPFIPICNDRLLFSHSSNLAGYVIDSIGAIDFSRAHFFR
jgi:oligopeptide transport system substrate-binding protein